MRWWIHSLGTRKPYLKDSLYSTEYPNELSRVACQCGSRQRRPVTLFSLVLLSFVTLLVVVSQDFAFPWLNRRKNMTFILWPKPPKPSAFIYGMQDIRTWSLASRPIWDSESLLAGILLLQRWMQKIPIWKLEGYACLLRSPYLMILKPRVNQFRYSQSGWIYIKKVNH